MKLRRLICLVLCLGLLFYAPPAAIAADVSFLAVNDSLPYALDAATMPFYSGGLLYIPYDIFNVSTLGVYTSYNPSNLTLVLFNQNHKLLFHIADGLVTNEDDEQYELSVIVRDNMVFVPAVYCVDYFGHSLSYLVSLGGYTVYRITTGSQVLSSSAFINQADKLMEERAQSYLDLVEPDQTVDPPQSQVPVVSVDPEVPDQTAPADEPVEPDPEEDPQQAASQTPPVRYHVYLAFQGISQAALDALAQRELTAAFFLTRAQIEADPQLVRQALCMGCSVGLVGANAQRLEDANDALYVAAGSRTLLTLGDDAQPGWLNLQADYTAQALSVTLPEDPDTPLLVTINADDALLADYLDLFAQRCTYMTLLETSPLVLAAQGEQEEASK